MGLVVFVPLAFLATWWAAATLKLVAPELGEIHWSVRLLVASLLYFLTMGWQPLFALWIVRRYVEAPEPMDLSLRPGAPALTRIAMALPLALAALAGLVHVVLLKSGEIGVPEAQLDHPSLLGALIVSVAFGATLLLLWTQALVEELGWRGFVLVRSMERFGAWRGLLVHGALWGVWYAPVVLVTTSARASAWEAIARVVGALVTGTLLGALLGWLRVASKSVLTSSIANGTLTLAAGVPYLVEGLDPGARAAILGPVGWLVLAAVLAALRLSRLRHTLRLPPRAGPSMLPATRSTALH